MKRLKYIAFTVLLASFSLQSCDLERYPLTDLSEDNFWTDDKNAELALTSLYRGSITNGLEYSVSDFWSYHGMLFMEHLTDNAYDRRGENNPFFNISSGKLLNNNSFIKNYWSSAYKRIGLCNRFLEGIANAPESEQKTRMVAEARFLRATQYHYLASYFKDVPLVTCGEPGMTTNIGCVSKADIDYFCKVLHDSVSEYDVFNSQRESCQCCSLKYELLPNKVQCAHRCLYCYWS